MVYDWHWFLLPEMKRNHFRPLINDSWWHRSKVLKQYIHNIWQIYGKSPKHFTQRNNTLAHFSTYVYNCVHIYIYIIFLVVSLGCVMNRSGTCWNPWPILDPQPADQAGNTVPLPGSQPAPERHSRAEWVPIILCRIYSSVNPNWFVLPYHPVGSKKWVSIKNGRLIPA